jgi:hypothetical protein
MTALPLHPAPHATSPHPSIPGPANTRAEALSAVARYARLAAFAAACALYVLVRYVVLRPRHGPHGLTPRP